MEKKIENTYVNKKNLIKFIIKEKKEKLEFQNIICEKCLN